MATVKENSRTWDMGITVFHVKTLRELVTNPIVLTDPNALGEILADEVKQYDLAWFLLEKQAVAQQLDAEQFAGVFTENYEQFAAALVGSLTDFFRKSKRADLAAIIENTLIASTKMQLQMGKNLSSMEQVTDAVVAKYERETEKNLQQILTNLSGDLPGSSE